MASGGHPGGRRLDVRSRSSPYHVPNHPDHEETRSTGSGRGVQEDRPNNWVRCLLKYIRLFPGVIYDMNVAKDELHACVSMSINLIT